MDGDVDRVLFTSPDPMRESFARVMLVVAAPVAALLCPAASGHAQQTPAAGHDAAPSVAAARRAGSVTIDGRLDDAAWQAATPATGFRQLDPQEGAQASERTEARILIDEDALYVGMRMFDSDPAAIQTQLARRDEGIEGDLVEVYLDSYHDHLNAFLFRLSPAGARRDATVTLGGNQDGSWDAVWEGKATVDAEGWSAEFRIPLSQLRFDPGVAEHTWGIQLARKIARKAEVAMFAFTPKNEQQGVHRYGHLTGLGRLASPRRLELTPYVLAKNANPTVARGDPFRTQNAFVPGAGLDVKYGITSNITLDATFNPDFGQVEVDPAVVNLSEFETFFPERRPFFVEGAGIFEFGSMRTNNSTAGYTFLHTRRIGRSPARDIGGPSIAFVDAPLETTIAGAAKLTGRTTNGWSFGVLDAVTMKEEARFQDADGREGIEVVEPMANYFTGRLKRDFRGGHTTVGAIISTVHRDLGDPELVPLFRGAAYSGGVDWQHAWADRRWAFDGAFVASHVIGSAASIDALQLSPARYLQRPDRESYFRDPTRTALGGRMFEATIAKIAGRHWRGSLTAHDYTPTLELNESGFLGEGDIRGFAPLIQYSENQPGRLFRNWQQYLFWNPTWNYDGDMTFNGVGYIASSELRNFVNLFFRLDWRPPVYTTSLTRGGPTAGVPEEFGWQAEVSSDRRKRYTFGAFTNRYWNEAGGWRQQVSPWATIRPATSVRLSLSPSYNRSHQMAQYVTRAVDPLASDTYGTRYVFATLDQHQVSMVTRLDWTFTPALSLQLFAQPLLAAGDYYDFKEFARPRTFDYAVYGRDLGTIARSDAGVYTVDPDGAGAAPAFSFADRDFNQRSLRGNAVLRWEYRPGSALFLVWQQSRFDRIGSGEFDFRDDAGELVATRPENVFVVKGTWWVGR